MANTKKSYESPEIVEVGPVSELTQGMGGSSMDMSGMTIPVVPEEKNADEGE